MRRIITAALTVLVLFTFSSCNWDVWENTVIDYGHGNGNITATLNFTGEAPKYAYATKSSYTNKIVVTWNGVTGADYYEVYRSEDLDTPQWKKLSPKVVKDTSYTDTNVEKGKTYIYEVRARSFSNLYLIGEFSNIAYGNTLTAPISFNASQGESSKEIHLSWSKVENITGYKIYWSLTGYNGTWNVLIPNGMQVTDYTFSSNTTESSFVPQEQYKGSYIYFYIVSVSNSGIESDPSAKRIGYTYVEGAPEKPKNFTASRGDSTNSITLSWDAMYPQGDSNLHYDWDIYRSKEGQSGILIYSTQNGSKEPEVSNNKMTYTDTSSLEEGVEYTYKIIAIGEITQEDGTVVSAKGKSATAMGFLFSPPSSIISKKIANGGFEFIFEDALGAQENVSWSYSVYGKANESDSWQILSNYCTVNVNEDGKYIIQTTYDSSSSTPEEQYQYFSISTNNSLGLSSKRYDEVYDKNGFYISKPEPVDSLTASNNTVFSHSKAQNGSYPVCLTLSSDNSVSYYEVRIWKTEVSSPSIEGYEQITIEPSSFAKDITILKDVVTTPIGTKYYFAVNGKDELGRESGWSKIVSGYSAITGATLIEYMQVYCFKPWEHIDSSYLTTNYPYPSKDVNTKWKNSQIYGKIKAAGTGSLSDGITESSYFHNGSVFYKAEVDGIGGAVTLSYNNFGEVEWMNTTGSYTMNVSAKGDGSITNNGGLTIKGMYPATIGMGNLNIKSQKFNGTYTVIQKNGLGAEEVSPNQY